MLPFLRGRMTLLDAVLLVGTATVGFGLFEMSHRTLFKGWIWLIDQGVPNVETWSTKQAIATCSDITVFLIPMLAPWTLLLIALRVRAPRRSWRRIWRQPGMAACLAAVFGWCWSLVALLLATDVGYVARSRRVITAEEWAQKYLGDEVFMYVGLAVAAAWLVQYFSGRWRRPVDWIDVMGRVVGVLWIVIGLLWTLHEYLEFV
jgi:hypothetical protein